MSKILVVDDEQSICWGITKVATMLGHEAEVAASAEEGLRLAQTSKPDVLVLDVRLPGIDGITAVEQFRQVLGDVPIIIITAFGDMQTAVRAVRSGAFEYLLKPFDVAEIRAAIERALRTSPVAENTAETAAPAAGDEPQLVGQTPVMQELFKQIALVAATDTSVLLQGESGAGKELVARAIHQHSASADRPFVAVNVAALSPTVAESELFGHVAGAYTGAQRGRDGLLVQANGGTLFLDEVADIPLPIQVKLLRAVEQGEVLPVGADQPVKTRFRIIGASHQNLKQRVQEGEFRHDLYFRLCAFEIVIPPLRQRADDIPLLVQHFASHLAPTPRAFAEETLAELARRPWHGNVRELRNAIEHAHVVARSGLVMPEHLPPAQPSFQATGDGNHEQQLTEASRARADELLSDPALAGDVYNRFLSEVERPLLNRAMDRFSGEYAPAARALGLHRTTLKKKLEEYEVPE
ncbi:sigma-54 dependent transcriptional regulator [Aeoliella sp. ICT_H6.2]|uniref:DNA-binding transcriptional regulator NtrC n=1 Tax=Aeoliella straminimaris TaxID=2954799 RepID=A0A9X2F9T6_9BACT|nr:sigma-54 dependent transcriptional regulator [Aeoliella straminimaris]MCO6045047.1 sigma-54 dependent transcriptional regulator [Aeoliella straminimaris]